MHEPDPPPPEWDGMVLEFHRLVHFESQGAVSGMQMG
jgi:hypothetical protein